MNVTKVLFLLSTLGIIASSCSGQTYVGIDFDNLAAPSGCTRSATAPSSSSFSIAPLKLPGVTVSGGQVLSYANPYQTYNNVYYTLNSCAGVTPVITITFAAPASFVNMVIGQFWTASEAVTAQDDCGDNITMDLLSSDVAGQSLFLPCSSVHTVTLTLPQGVWSASTPAGFYIDSLDFYLNQGLNFVDPVPELMTGSGVVSDPESLATLGTLVRAVAADGVARVLLTAEAAQVGQTVSFSLLNDQGAPSISSAADGGLGPVGGPPGFTQQTIRVTAQDTSQGPMAFALYYAPQDFARGPEDYQSASRNVQIMASVLGPSAAGPSAAVPSTAGVSAATYSKTLTILRPPVVLVHDLWEEPANWDGFPLNGDARFFIRRASYDNVLGGEITASIPAYQTGNLADARESSLGIPYNSPHLLTQIAGFIDEFRGVENAAAGQADMVVHGMGGVITRASVQLPNYNAPESYGQGNVDKMITLGTPHLGTPLATELLRNENSCFADILASAGEFSFATATVNGASVTGGIGDLAGNGFGGGLSQALAVIQQFAGDTVPTGFLGGIMTLANTSGIMGATSPAGFIRQACNGTLANNLTPLGWMGLFGDFTDGFVGLTSELAGLAGSQYTGLVHSAGMERLGFNPPGELDAQSPMATAVTGLLNSPAHGNSFHPLP